VQEDDDPIAVDVAEEQPYVSFFSYCGFAFVEMVKKRFITSGEIRVNFLPCNIGRW
jgi:hypothetical protein